MCLWLIKIFLSEFRLFTLLRLLVKRRSFLYVKRRTKCDDDDEKGKETVKCLWDRNANYYLKFACFLCACALRIVFHWIIQIIIVAVVESAMHKTDGVVDKFQSQCVFVFKGKAICVFPPFAQITDQKCHLRWTSRWWKCASLVVNISVFICNKQKNDASNCQQKWR